MLHSVAHVSLVNYLKDLVNVYAVIQFTIKSSILFKFKLIQLIAPIFAPVGLIALRSKVRTGFRIDGSVCQDCCASCVCCLCVMLQIHSELNHQGL